MNISKFLLIDVAIVIAGIPLVFLLQGDKKKSPLLRSPNKKKLIRKTSVKLPDKEKLIELEKLARMKGSGIKFDSLKGDWKFVSVWEKDSENENSIFSSLLRVFAAKIEFKKDLSNEFPQYFSIVTSIKFGFFSMEFSGSGYLKGKQPILPFFFNLIQLKSGSSILFSKSLKEPLEKDKSCFEMISSEESYGWLSARGQGGALLLWLKD